MNSIKITSGKFRGRNIASPNLDTTHPMGAREKLALFNMIGDFLPGAAILDAYAGSGALGIEALSRGASYATFVEKNHRAAQTIRKNLADLDLTAISKVYECGVEKFLVPEKFDIIFADPPYDNFEVAKINGLSAFLKEAGVLVLSHPGDAPEIDGLALQKTKTYANARVSIYAKLVSYGNSLHLGSSLGA